MNYQVAGNEVERAYDVLKQCGIPRSREHSVAHGILALEHRYAREVAAMRIENQRLRNALQLIAEETVCPELWSKEHRQGWSEDRLVHATALVIAVASLDDESALWLDGGGPDVLRVYSPLTEDHPLVTDENCRCAICQERFEVGQRATLIPLEIPERARVVEAVPAHARCAGLEEEPP